MAIRQSKYIDITSGVGGASAVKNREFIARCLTTNVNKVGVGHVMEFNDYDSVISHFGNSSEEAKFAKKYFGFTSKNITTAKKISFSGWSKTAKFAQIVANTQYDTTMSKYTGSKQIVFVIGNEDIVINVSISELPESIEDVLTILQTAMRSDQHFDSDTTVATTEEGTIKIVLGNQTETISPCKPLANNDLGALLKLTSNVVCSDGFAGTAESAVSLTKRVSDNFGTLVFLHNTDVVLTNDEVVAVARLVKSWNYLCEFVFGRKCYTLADGSLSDTDLTSLAEQCKGIEGISLWAYKHDDDYIEALPAALFATTDYSRSNSTKTFMYQQGDFNASITSDAGANALDQKNVNYMGQTSFAGGLIDFSQDGVNCDGEEISVYCNEVWLKSAIWTAIMNLFLAVEKVPANEDGAIMLRTVMMDSIETAIRNGTISKMKTLNTTQKLYITNVTGNDKAWESVYTDGFYLSITIEKNDDGKYVAKYLLVYSKGDAIRKVEGSDILI